MFVFSHFDDFVCVYAIVCGVYLFLGFEKLLILTLLNVFLGVIGFSNMGFG